jgi:hypothetical protein
MLTHNISKNQNTIIFSFLIISAQRWKNRERAITSVRVACSCTAAGDQSDLLDLTMSFL